MPPSPGWPSAPERFLLWLHLYDPHSPYAPPEPHHTRQLGRPYEGEIAFADEQLGRLLAAIDARFPADGTVAIVTSDHGESLGEHGEATHAFSIYDATQRVPLLMAGPGLPSGAVVTAGLARLADVAPTVIELAGAAAWPRPRAEACCPSCAASRRRSRASPGWRRSPPSSTSAGARCSAFARGSTSTCARRAPSSMRSLPTRRAAESRRRAARAGEPSSTRRSRRAAPRGRPRRISPSIRR